MTDPLTEAERAHVDLARSQSHDAALIEIIDRLSAAPRAEREALALAEALAVAREALYEVGLPYSPPTLSTPDTRCASPAKLAAIADRKIVQILARDALAAPAPAEHDEDCPMADPVSDHEAAIYYAETGRLDEDICTCDPAPAEPREGEVLLADQGGQIGSPEGWRWKWCDCIRSGFGSKPHPVWVPTDAPEEEA